MKNFGVIYCAKNLINSKVYIGKTSHVNPVKYCEEHIFQSEKIKNNKKYFYRAIQKYGCSMFLWSIIDHAYNLKELNEKEKYWISQLESTNPNKGYNIALGGDGGNTRAGMSDEDKLKFNVNISNYWKNMSQEEKQKISEMRSYNAKNSTIETRLKISNGLKGKKRTELQKQNYKIGARKREDAYVTIKKNLYSEIVNFLSTKSFVSYQEILQVYPCHLENLRKYMYELCKIHPIQSFEVPLCILNGKRTHIKLKLFTLKTSE